jgi:uncharacterized membrane protein YgdD (TMEM256/DUF423 family)
MLQLPWLAIGAFCCAVAIIGGAFGAHALRVRLDGDAMALWQTAARYLMYGGLGLMLVGAVAQGSDRRGLAIAGASLLIGSLLFSTTTGALALGAPRWLGAVTPLGGLLMIIGFVLFGWAALQS